MGEKLKRWKLKEDPYELLGVSHNASLAEMRRARRRLARELHPDLDKVKDGGAAFAKVDEAWAFLSDPEARRHYDESLKSRSTRSSGNVGGSSGRKPSPKNEFRHPHAEPAGVSFGTHRSVQEFRKKVVQVSKPSESTIWQLELSSTFGTFWVIDVVDYLDAVLLTCRPQLTILAAGLYEESFDIWWRTYPQSKTTIQITAEIAPEDTQTPEGFYVRYDANGDPYLSEEPLPDLLSQNQDAVPASLRALLWLIAAFLTVVIPWSILKTDFIQHPDGPINDLISILFPFLTLGLSVFGGIGCLVKAVSSLGKQKSR